MSFGSNFESWTSFELRQRLLELGCDVPPTERKESMIRALKKKIDERKKAYSQGRPLTPPPQPISSRSNSNASLNRERRRSQGRRSSSRDRGSRSQGHDEYYDDSRLQASSSSRVDVVNVNARPSSSRSLNRRHASEERSEENFALPRSRQIVEEVVEITENFSLPRSRNISPRRKPSLPKQTEIEVEDEEDDDSDESAPNSSDNILQNSKSPTKNIRFSDSNSGSEINVGQRRRTTENRRSRSRGKSSLARRSSSSREVTALPIEIPDSVTDEDAFRRYLSVRRGAHIDIRPHTDFELQNSYESVGAGRPVSQGRGPGRLPPAMAVKQNNNNNNNKDSYRRTACLCFAVVSLALLSASTSQLRFVVAYSKAHAYPVLNYFLICVSITIEVVAGVGFVLLSRIPLSDSRIDYINGYLIAGLFIVAINNVIIAAFAFDDHVCELLAKQTEMLDVIEQTPVEKMQRKNLILSQSKLKISPKPFPKSHSANFINSTMPSTSTIQNHQPAGAFRARTAEDVQEEDVWGDDLDDDFFIQATQVTMEQIIEDNKNRPVNANHSNYQPRQNCIGFPRMNSDEKPLMTPTECFNLRRKALEEREANAGQSSSFILTANDDDLRKAKQKIDTLELEMKVSKTEMEKLRGESSHFKREWQRLRGEMSTDWKRVMGFKKEKDDIQKKHEAELRELNRQLEELKCAELKDRFKGVGGKKKDVTINGHTSFNILNNDEPMDQSEAELRPTSSFPRSNSPTASQVRKEAEIQTEEEMSISGIGSQSQSQNVSTDLNELDLELTCRVDRGQIFCIMEKIVNINYQIVAPILKQVEKTAARLILEKLVPKTVSKTGLNDVVETMYERVNDKERRRALKAQGRKSAGMPTLPSAMKPDTQYYEIKAGLETSFKFGGVWGALAEVRNWIEKLLKSLDGLGRFRIYEHHALANFYRLLYWGKEFWRSILMEEEAEDDVVKNKKRWVEELEGWTGLVLKCDWRDYFVLELEVEVRKVTLGILEYIITAGYFEQKANRYRILYRISRDVLTRDCFQNSENIRHILKIITWSISDVHIMKYMCFKDNESTMCLARLIGECFLKLIQEEENEKDVVFLFLDYAHLVERLMLKRPFPYFQSKYAREMSGAAGEDHNTILKTRSDLYRNTQTQLLMPMDVTNAEVGEVAAAVAVAAPVAASQFACPVRYDKKPVKVQPKAPKLKVKKEVEKLVDCWLEPRNYEDPFGNHQYCQCRKVLVGTAVIALELVFDAWKEKYIEYERVIEHQLDREESERKTLESSQNLTESSTKRLKELQDKKAAMEKLLQACTPILEKHYHYKELSLINVIRHKKEIVESGILDFFPDSIAKMKRKHDIFDVALSKGIFIINFLQHKSDNLAAALGTDGYKAYMSLIPEFRTFLPQIDFNRINKDLLIALTAECEEHRGKRKYAQPPGSVTNPSIEYLIPLTPLVAFRPMSPEDLENLTKESKKLSGNKPSENERDAFPTEYSKLLTDYLSFREPKEEVVVKEYTDDEIEFEDDDDELDLYLNL